jgi:hypothetical protein
VSEGVESDSMRLAGHLRPKTGDRSRPSFTLGARGLDWNLPIGGGNSVEPKRAKFCSKDRSATVMGRRRNRTDELDDAIHQAVGSDALAAALGAAFNEGFLGGAASFCAHLYVVGS